MKPYTPHVWSSVIGRRGASRDQRPIDGHKDKVQEDCANDNQHDVLEGLLEDLPVRGAQLNPHDDYERPIVQEAHRHSVAGHPLPNRRYQLPDNLPGSVTPVSH